MPMKDLPADQRPREKLLARGAAALTDAELLALLLRTGLKGQGVLALAQQVLTHFKGYAGLLAATSDQLKLIKGLGPAKRAEITAVMEMARRALVSQMAALPVYDSPAALRQFVALRLSQRPAEAFLVLFLDARYRLLSADEMFQGTLSHTPVYPREVVRRAIELNAAAVVLAHNHPSGVAEPSIADEELTKTLKASLRLIDVVVLDHLIVGHGSVVSMAERCLI